MFTNCSIENSTCTNCTQNQLTLARGITSAVCCIIWVIVLVVLLIFAKRYYQRACGTCVKRLTFGLTISTILLQCFLTLNFIHLIPKFNEMNNCTCNFCKADSFLFPYFQGLQLLFILEICFVLIFKVLEATPRKCTSIHEKIKEWNCKTLHKKTKATVCGHKLEFAACLCYNIHPPPHFKCNILHHLPTILWLFVVCILQEQVTRTSGRHSSKGCPICISSTSDYLTFHCIAVSAVLCHQRC